MPNGFEGVPVDLAAVEATIRVVEEQTGWDISLPGRTVIHQLFVSLSADQGGFEIAMPATTRQAALKTAQDNLSSFLNTLVSKSQDVAKRSGYQGKEVGFPVVVHEIDNWATTRIKCSCWPR